eukprot:185148-Pyramimonas_sp.AAC.1
MSLEGCSDRLQQDSRLHDWKCVASLASTPRQKAVALGWLKTGAGWQLTADTIKHRLGRGTRHFEDTELSCGRIRAGSLQADVVR